MKRKRRLTYVNNILASFRYSDSLVVLSVAKTDRVNLVQGQYTVIALVLLSVAKTDRVNLVQGQYTVIALVLLSVAKTDRVNLVQGQYTDLPLRFNKKSE